MDKFIVVGDLHLSNKAPSSRTDPNFLATCQNKLTQILEASQQPDITALLLLGDLFNSPCPSYPVLIMFITSFLQKVGCPIYTIVGNHDVFSRSMKTMERTALFLLQSTTKLTVISPMFTPYVLFPETCIYISEKPETDKIPVEMVHELLTEELEFAGTIPASDYRTEAEIVISGHYHPGFKKEVNGKLFLNPGSLLRTNISEQDRQPYFAILTPKTKEYELIEIHVLGESTFNPQAANVIDVESLRTCLALFSREQVSLSIESLVQEVGLQNNFSNQVIQEVLKRLNADRDQVAT